MKVLKFVKAHSPYMVGDIAGFRNDKDCEEYLKAKSAVEVKAPTSEKKAEVKENKQIVRPEVNK